MKYNSTNPNAIEHSRLCSDATTTHSSTPGDLGRAQRILVADDNESIRQIMSHTLASANFCVDAAADGEEAWRAVQCGHYDLLVTDNDMPRLTGLELVKRIRDAGLRLPVIMASASISEAWVRDCASLQVAVVPKPFALRDFLNTVNNALRPSAETATANAASFAQPPALRSQPKKEKSSRIIPAF